MRKEPEPLNELLLQQFPRKDPIELEQMTKTVEKWLEQKLKFYEKCTRQVAKQMGQNATPTKITRTYSLAVKDLLRELDPNKYPLEP